MAHVQRARSEVRTAYLSTDFGLSYAVKLFGQEAVDAIPKISRGVRKGAVKGMLCWEKCVEGGWTNDGGFGHVCYPGFVRAWIETREGWGRTERSVIVMETHYPSFEIKLRREAEEAALRAAEIARQEEELRRNYIRSALSSALCIAIERRMAERDAARIAA